MKTTKRWLSLILSLIMVVGIFAIAPLTVSATQLSESEFVSKISILQSTFRHGEYWNKYNSSNYSQTGSKPCSGYSTETGQYCTSRGYCVYCTCDCGYFDGAWQCMGYAYKMAYECFGISVRNTSYWEKSNSLGTICAGDVIRLNNYNNTISDWHSIFVYKVVGDTIYYTECNNAGPCKVTWGNTMSYSSINNRFCYKLHYKGNTLTGNGTHAHSYDTYVYYWDAHPHYKCYQCVCGEVKENRNEPVYISNCSQCRVEKTTVYSDKTVYCTGERVELTWDAAANATHYNFYIMRKDNNGEYKERIDWITELEQTAYYIYGLSDGEYMIELYSYDKNHWEADGSDWCHEMADLIYFTVSNDTKINQHIGMFYNNNRYELYNATMSWKDAKAYCERQGGHLVTISSDEENEAITSFVNNGGYSLYWIGYSDIETEGDWKSVTGEDATYHNWGSGNPDNYNGDEDCCVIKKSGFWGDVNNMYSGDIVGFICEYEIEEPKILLGDADCDGTVNVKDATAIQKHIANITTLSEDGCELADVDSSDDINIKDATAIQKYIAGIETGFPIG